MSLPGMNARDLLADVPFARLYDLAERQKAGHLTNAESLALAVLRGGESGEGAVGLRAHAPTWGTKTPTVPGWYWVRYSFDGGAPRACPVFVHAVEGDKCYAVGDKALVFGGSDSAEWSGPIEPPTTSSPNEK